VNVAGNDRSLLSSRRIVRGVVTGLSVGEGKDMAILRIEHSVPNYETWKRAFDNDPASRKQSGVRHYQILRSMDEPNYVMIDLEFETKSEAEALLTSMREVWARVEGMVMWNPQARIVEVVESKDY
jgi:hypothetical protein